MGQNKDIGTVCDSLRNYNHNQDGKRIKKEINDKNGQKYQSQWLSTTLHSAQDDVEHDQGQPALQQCIYGSVIVAIGGLLNLILKSVLICM